MRKSKARDKLVKDVIRTIANDELVDIVGGPMRLDEVSSEIGNIVLNRSPEYMVILIEKRPEIQKYHTTLYITKHDFRHYKSRFHYATR